MFKFSKLISSFRHAFEGLELGFKREQSFRLQLIITVIIIAMMIVLPLHNIERAILVLAIGIVLGLELLNSQLERILDLISQEYDGRIKAIKDLSAAAVLIAVVASVLVGLFIFLPYLI